MGIYLKKMSKTWLLVIITAGLNLVLLELSAQSNIPEKEYIHNTGLWLGTYTQYQFRDKWFYHGEYHYRRRNQFIKDMNQVYLRFGATYRYNDEFEITGGIATPAYLAPKGLINADPIIWQFRFWQQFLMVQHLERAKIYHQFRFEQRWAREFIKETPYQLTHRLRYKFATYIPINNKQLTPGTYFASLNNEIIIQAGKSIKFNYFEDNRLFLGLGYVWDDNIQLQAGYMWTFRHAGSPFRYEHRHIPRVSLYHSLDFRQQAKPYRAIPDLPEF
jgi:hypothetical protein